LVSPVIPFLRVLAMERLDGYLRIQEAAEFLGVSPNTLRNWGREEKIAEFRHPVNNYRLYRRSDLEELLRIAMRSPRARNRQRRQKARQ
jgi:predicted site-specific integrase-resolvase